MGPYVFNNMSKRITLHLQMFNHLWSCVAIIKPASCSEISWAIWPRNIVPWWWQELVGLSSMYDDQPASIPHIVHVLPTILAHFEPILRLSNSLPLKGHGDCQKADASRSPKHPAGTTLPKNDAPGHWPTPGHLIPKPCRKPYRANYSGPVSASGSIK